MDDPAELLQQIGALFAMMNLEVPSADTDLFDTGLLDSMTFVDLLVQLEEKLGISVSLDQLEPDNFRSIQRIASFVLAQQKPLAVRA